MSKPRHKARRLLLATTAIMAASIGGQALAASINVPAGGEVVWTTGQTVNMTAGDDTITIAPGGRLITVLVNYDGNGIGANPIAIEAPTVVNFGAGTNTFTNAGAMYLGPTKRPAEGFDDMEVQLRLDGTNLTFINSGDIYLGSFRRGEEERPQPADLLNQTDGWFDDMLLMAGAHYVGQGGTIHMDVNLGGGAQSSCSASLRSTTAGPTLGNLPAADCVGIIGGTTEGTTFLRINDVFPDDLGRYDPDGTVLIDVSGGTSGAGHFTLDPGSDAYSPANGGIIEKHYFFYGLIYDDTTQQHKLVGLPGVNALQSPLLAQAGHSLWRTSTGSWFERQADLRDDLDGVGGGWLRISGESAQRDVLQTQTIGTTTLSFDNTFEQDSYAVTGGVDLMRGGGSDRAYVLGVMAGYANSELRFDTSSNTAQIDGWTGGVYATLLSGSFFVDAVVNANKMVMVYDVPSLALLPSGSVLDTDFVTVGAQVEGGWRIPLADRAFVEPLVSVSYVKSMYDDLEVPARDPVREGFAVQYDDPVSLRASIGGRFGLNTNVGPARAQISLLGRLWNESEGETQTTIHNPGEDAVLVQEFNGRFTEFGVGVNLFGLGDALSGFAGFGGKFGDNYNSQNLSAGVRVAW